LATTVGGPDRAVAGAGVVPATQRATGAVRLLNRWPTRERADAGMTAIEPKALPEGGLLVLFYKISVRCMMVT